MNVRTQLSVHRAVQILLALSFVLVKVAINWQLMEGLVLTLMNADYTMVLECVQATVSILQVLTCVLVHLAGGLWVTVALVKILMSVKKVQIVVVVVKMLCALTPEGATGAPGLHAPQDSLGQLLVHVGTVCDVNASASLVVKEIRNA